MVRPAVAEVRDEFGSGGVAADLADPTVEYAVEFGVVRLAVGRDGGAHVAENPGQLGPVVVGRPFGRTAREQSLEHATGLGDLDRHLERHAPHRRSAVGLVDQETL
ncbi:MAG: hypothetical protein WKF60_13415, partial [Ilumatobacter sp.]